MDAQEELLAVNSDDHYGDIVQFDEVDDSWYFKMSSELYGTEEFGPYDSYQEARAGINRVEDSAYDLHDGVHRWFMGPYQGSREDEDDEEPWF